MNWQGKAVLITGAASGMGFAFAERFALAGAHLALADISADRLAAASSRLGRDACTITTDVAKVADCARMVEETLTRFGRLDLLINSAGIWVEGAAEEVSEAEWDRCIDINLKGTFFACRHAIPALCRSGGAIINIASDAGVMGSAGASVYCASKGGVVQLTRALALELAPKGVRCNAVCPCDVETPMLAGQARDYGGRDPEGYRRKLLAIYPQGEGARFVRPEEVAEFVFAVAGLEPITGACLSIDFGTTAGR
jgi:NAD(P)-dependent dehydrogenase (short-subunit alcohol dehydrogenase family)